MELKVTEKTMVKVGQTKYETTENMIIPYLQP